MKKTKWTASSMGKKGGRIGGKVSWGNLTPEQRIEKVRKAGLASGLARRKK